eukprot:TRINITY_DN78_c0_g2_i1.p1 TRINITY_DN78_c0_g2~~TRINITY_DN78_c0_g2_i1.p1  ORF type:complete len:203 (-),score=95.50 TRINITY_DN78_c0_g2_i1:303-911(-)
MGCSGSKNVAAAPAAAAAPVAPEADFKVALETTEATQPLGLTIVSCAQPAVGILVQTVKEEGLVPTYNKQYESTPEQQVAAGDVIVAVNGIFGDYEQMTKELQQQKKLTLSLRRPAAGAAAERAEKTAEEQQPEKAAPAGEPAAEPEVVAAAASGEAAAEPAAVEPAEAPTPLAPREEVGEVPVTEAGDELAASDEKKTCCC